MATEVQFACALVVLLCCGCACLPTPPGSFVFNYQNCTTVPTLENGTVTLQHNESWMIRYHFNCSSGYELQGQSTTTCFLWERNWTIWTNSLPSCVPLNITTTLTPTFTSTTPVTTGTSIDPQNTTHPTHHTVRPTRRPINLLRFGYTPWAIITLVVIILLVVWIVNCCMGPMF
ncbi:membrane protein E3 [Equid gammaherpesvirus 2]|nr:membrane protein E3 [Equid gammaherpesvirus 2]UTM04546.1 membrane protein E3 [Equid gammaherpesvirus 2]UTM05018.1 membrane protein E3 [Equid gammaherpesvirus 2]